MSDLEFTISGTIPASRKEAFLEAILEAMEPAPPEPIPEGATKMWITVPSEQEVTVSFRADADPSMTIDWGDGSACDQTTHDSGNASASHTFAAGEYTISAWGKGNYGLGYASTYPLVSPLTTLTTVVGGDGCVMVAGLDGATALRALTLGNDCTNINARSVRNCTSLVSVDMGTGMTTISANAFNGCTSLASITCRATTPPTVGNANVFTNVPADCAIYVPAGSVSAYKAASVWSARADYIQAIPA